MTEIVDELSYYSPSCTSPKFKADLRMLSEIGPGDIIFMLGRWLTPYCSHATYRVRVSCVQFSGNACRRIHGTLIDFKDSPVISMNLPEKQYFRVDTSAKEMRWR